jgi:hypothetical protein
MTDLKQLCVSFITTLSTFEYFKDSTRLLEYINAQDASVLGNGMAPLIAFMPEILNIINSEQPQSNKKFKFLESITLFDGQLKLDIFKNENKNTKKAIVKHLSNLLAASYEYTKNEFSSSVLPQFEGKSMEGMIDVIQKSECLSGIIDKFSNKLTSSEIDPMQLLSSLMSGDINNSAVKGLIDEVQSDISKMDAKDIERLTAQIGSFMK